MKNANASPTELSRLGALLWLALVAGLLLLLLTLWPQARLNSSVLALLPNQSMGKTPPAITEGFLARLDKQLVWLVSPGTGEDPAVAQYWLELLQGSDALTEVKGPVDARQQADWGAFLYQHRNGNLDPQTRQRLQTGQQPQWVLSQLYSAFAGVSGQELRHDPLMLVRGAQLAMASQASRLSLKQGWLVSRDAAGRSWYLVRAQLAGSAFDMGRSHALVQQLSGLQQQLQARYPQAQVLSRGSLFYSDYASSQAKGDLSTLGSATVLGVLLLIVGVFRSLRPMLLCLLSIAVGALAGTVAVLLVYGELHLMTLVMSVSIVGISADYSLYYLTERMVHGAQQSRAHSLHKVRAALLLALLTTVSAYLIMMLAPFPGIRQLALFAASGLTAACLTVLCWHPWLSARLPVRPVPAMGLMLRWLAAWRRQRRLSLGLPLLLAALAALGLSQLTVNDDIRQLQSLPTAIQAQERQVTQLTGQTMEQKGFVLYGDDAQATLARLEAFEPKLQQAQAAGWLRDYRRLPLNSLARQQQDLALLHTAAPQVQAALAAAGLPAVNVDLTPMPVTLADWLASPVSEGWRLMWLSLADGRSALFVPVNGVKDSQALGRLAEAQPGVAWVDRKASFDALFSLYRTLLSGLLLVALGVIAISALLRLGWRQGCLSLVPTLLSLACGLAALAASGQPVNLFSLLALVLVLGIGINYTLFFSNPKGTPLTSLLAITLAMATTLLTLGMLVFSRTQAISSFGIVLCSGIFTAYLLSPLAMPPKRREKKRP